MGALCLAPWLEFSEKSWTAWTALGSLAILCTFAAYHCHYAALKYLEAGRAAIAATLEPVVAGVVAFFWWGEYFSMAGYVGSLLIITAVILMVRDRSESATREEESPS